jgi:hypothetical protein
MSLLNGLVKVHVKPRWASPVTSAAS